MSIQWMSAVWEASSAKGASLLAMLAFADWSNDAGTCYPSMPGLAHRTRASRRNIYYVVRGLVDSERVAVIEKPTPFRSARYRIIEADVVGYYQLVNNTKFRPQERGGEVQRLHRGEVQRLHLPPVQGLHPPEVQGLHPPEVQGLHKGGATVAPDPSEIRYKDGKRGNGGPPSAAGNADADADAAAGAWLTLMDWIPRRQIWDACDEWDRQKLIEGGETEPQLEPDIHRLFKLVGGWRRAHGWKARTQDMTFCRDEFIKAFTRSRKRAAS